MHVSTRAPDRSALLCLLSGPVLRWLFATLFPQPEPASRLKSATRDVNFLRSDSRCRRYASDLSEVFGLGAEGQDFVVVVDFWLTFSFLVVKVKGCRHHFSSAEL